MKSNLTRKLVGASTKVGNARRAERDRLLSGRVGLKLVEQYLSKYLMKGRNHMTPNPPSGWIKVSI